MLPCRLFLQRLDLVDVVLADGLGQLFIDALGRFHKWLAVDVDNLNLAGGLDLVPERLVLFFGELALPGNRFVRCGLDDLLLRRRQFFPGRH